MAGHRRPSKKNDFRPAPPVQKTLREQRRLRALKDRLAAATTPSDRIGAAAAYLRSVIGYAAPARAEAVADQVVEQFRALGRAIYEDRPTPERRRSTRGKGSR
jgi:hypothetical protein